MIQYFVQLQTERPRELRGRRLAILAFETSLAFDLL